MVGYKIIDTYCEQMLTSKGMAKPVADVRAPAENAAGYVSDDNPISGFSHMHDSGKLPRLIGTVSQANMT